MRPRLTPITTGLVCLLISSLTAMAEDPPAKPAPVPANDISFKFEVHRAIDRGLQWMKAQQNEAGWWSAPEHPALTAFALLTFQGDPKQRYRKSPPAWMEKGYEILLGAAHEDGGIHKNQLKNYNTALSMMALLGAGRDAYTPIIVKARNYVATSQQDYNSKGVIDHALDGGIGYGSSYPHSDMANTLQALEALYYSSQIGKDRPDTQLKDLNWDALLHFVQGCQNLPSHNKASWASDDPAQKGGFIYFPGNSKAGKATNAVTKRVALRSYGSISYAGMLSYSYAKLDKDDPRVKAVFDWLVKNYTLKENPGMGPQGLFYYYHTMAKALTAYQIGDLKLADGSLVDWRRELAMHLINLQKPDGSWLNDAHGRWWERDPVLVTAYALLALETMYKD